MFEYVRSRISKGNGSDKIKNPKKQRTFNQSHMASLLRGVRVLLPEWTMALVRPSRPVEPNVAVFRVDVRCASVAASAGFSVICIL